MIAVAARAAVAPSDSERFAFVPPAFFVFVFFAVDQGCQVSHALLLDVYRSREAKIYHLSRLELIYGQEVTHKLPLDFRILFSEFPYNI